jgi:hypothetical protein
MAGLQFNVDFFWDIHPEGNKPGDKEELHTVDKNTKVNFWFHT